ncbi:hypothetical protein GYMLUDRAFT_252279 [Collybiopsis luxurians FD-317 M1]|uniref:Uncharacterized protein n=1 Tax=Collybiopsis luxurians FD-317 M1 TaxID=944289 RepID=A0A0D0ALR2_9AGAR|nr:hypothetical protein GYMLUDRAFT_252279 [Collybiopsis luxurians FD-317 M1]
MKSGEDREAPFFVDSGRADGTPNRTIPSMPLRRERGDAVHGVATAEYIFQVLTLISPLRSCPFLALPVTNNGIVETFDKEKLRAKDSPVSPQVSCFFVFFLLKVCLPFRGLFHNEPPVHLSDVFESSATHLLFTYPTYSNSLRNPDVYTVADSGTLRRKEPNRRFLESTFSIVFPSSGTS